jgi:flagellar protein FliL
MCQNLRRKRECEDRMTDTAMPQDAAPKGSKLPLIAGLVLAASLGAGGFFATYKDLLGLDVPPEPAIAAVRPGQNITHVFVPLDPLVISLGGRGEARHLRFVAELEVLPAHEAEVARLAPRVLDVINVYLRALEAHEIEEPAALLRLRGQMLRRVQIVTGPGLVSDLLITEFVLN